MEKKLVPILLLSAVSTLVQAETLAPQLITNLGCDQLTKQCTLTLGTGNVGPTECVSNKISWESESTQGKLALALLSSALMTQHEVSISVSPVCSNNGLPELEAYELLARTNN